MKNDNIKWSILYLTNKKGGDVGFIKEDGSFDDNPPQAGWFSFDKAIQLAKDKKKEFEEYIGREVISIRFISNEWLG